MSAVTNFPILAILWGVLLALLAILDPVVAMIVAVGSLFVNTGVFFVVLVSISPHSQNTIVPRWNFLTVNSGAAALISLVFAVALQLLFSSGVVEFEIMPVPT